MANHFSLQFPNVKVDKVQYCSSIVKKKIIKKQLFPKLSEFFMPE